MANRRSDDTLRGARNLQFNRTVRDSLGQRDRVDFYKFRASGLVDIDLSLTGLKANASLRLLSNRGRVLATSNRPGKRSEEISRTFVNSGTYYVQVQFLGRRGTTRYNLRATATVPSPEPPLPPAPPGDPDGTIATAFDIGVVTTTTTVRQDSVGTNDLVDFYKFTLNDIANLDVRVNDSARVRNVQLIRDQNNNGLVDDGEVFAPRSFSSLSPLDIPPGTYFIRVEGFSNISSAYELTLVPTLFGGNVSPEPGNTLPSASETLGAFSVTGTDTRTVKEYVGILDETDIYKFELNDLSNLQITATVSSTPVQVQLIRDDNSNGLIDNGEAFLSREGSGLVSPARINTDLPAGTYFINVDPRFGNNFGTSYEMTLVGTPYGGNGLPDPGNTLPAARNFGTLSGRTTLKEYVGVLDSIDIYKFTLSNAANLQVRLTSSSDIDVDLALIQDTNNNDLIDNGETVRTGINSLTRDLQAGTYFLTVEPRFRNQSTNYELNLIVP
jgi:hypothetical protein